MGEESMDNPSTPQQPIPIPTKLQGFTRPPLSQRRFALPERALAGTNGVGKKGGYQWIRLRKVPQSNVIKNDLKPINILQPIGQIDTSDKTLHFFAILNVIGMAISLENHLPDPLVSWEKQPQKCWRWRVGRKFWAPDGGLTYNIYVYISYIYISYMFPVPGSPAPPQWYGPPRSPPCQQLPITYVYLLPAIPYYLYTTYYLLLRTTTYYQLLTTTYPTPPHPTGGGGIGQCYYY